MGRSASELVLLPAQELYRATREAADWSALLLPGQSFSVDARIGSCTGAIQIQTCLILLGMQA